MALSSVDIQLREEIILAIRKNAPVKRRLCYEMQWSERKLYHKLSANHIDLTGAKVLSIISDELNIPKEDLLTEEAA